MSSYSTGQRVLCIDGKFHPLVWEFVNEVPLDGRIYTARGARHGDCRRAGARAAEREHSHTSATVESRNCLIARRSFVARQNPRGKVRL